MNIPHVGTVSGSTLGTSFVRDRYADSIIQVDESGESLRRYRDVLEEISLKCDARSFRIPLDDMEGWVLDPESGFLRHERGFFFSVEGLRISIPGAPVPEWGQPIINQAEVGLLGILVKEFSGVMHCLMQAKYEPGNVNGTQLSPTVQATRSNFTRAHGGKTVPYLEYFDGRPGTNVVLDVDQSEQGAWFYQKTNRNVVVETKDEVELLQGFLWIPLAVVYRLLAFDDLVNMPTRSVLACLLFIGEGFGEAASVGSDDFRGALLRSSNPRRTRERTSDIVDWISERRAGLTATLERVRLDELDGWSYENGTVSHKSGGFFSVVGVDVEAGEREVSRWSQPMIEPRGTGIVAFLTSRIDGVLHVLIHARVEPGLMGFVELAPTVQCTPENYEHLPPSAWPPFLEEVREADDAQVRFSSVLSEEGGRFRHARSRYLIVETEPSTGVGHRDYRWVTLAHLADLLRRSNYVNVQARSLVACLYSLADPLKV
ncbi:NDP-hexose 2,3-dehydratase family protein [Nocardiopsis sp. CC223A]|uniref:NDP-hexose 2,3-dehydratase family protein n=1 Tax=Nocardiopsis sp. CC223A TaxID=3044051 RepID=UPI00278C5F80|nr:NDP-hexose 2,3-dehydratase family protein [Nocardiopsis sp. CC223A]